MQPQMIGGRYRTMSAIGRGGMGTVWLCRDETLQRDVAVKQVGLLPGESATSSARALREARSSAGLNHHNVVTVFDVVEEDGHIWLVMEHVAGRSLSQIIKEDGPLDPGRVADIGAQVAAGLTALHAAGTMHRDVKPGNVLIREDGVAKVSDFGISRTTGDATLTQSGFLTGTPSYFSPALARGIEPGPADDVWALGATLYAAVEGRPPYDTRSNPVAVLHDISSAQPRQPQRADFLEPALQRMLDRDPSSRWSMGDAEHMLRRLAETRRIDATRESTLVDPPPGAAAPQPATDFQPAPESKPAPERRPAPVAGPAAPRSARPSRPTGSSPRPGQRRRVPYAVLAVVVLVAAIALAVTRLGDRDEPSADPGGGSGGETSSKTSGSADEGSTSSQSEAEVKEAVVRDYYQLAPGGSDEAWAMLGPGLQEQGRASYDRFWRGIESVEVRSAQASTEDDTVEVTLVYRRTNGQTSTERKVETLISDGDEGYLIESDVPAG